MNRETDNNKEDRKEDARVGYQVAVDLAIKEENLFWAQFNAILIANSIFITAISFIICKNCADLKDQMPELLEFMAIIGMVLCILWFLLTKRRLSYHKYYLFSAREIEHELQLIRTILRGRDFSEGNPVGFRIDNKNEKAKYELFQLPLFGRLRIEYWSYLVIAIFFLIYLYLFVKNIEYFQKEYFTIMALFLLFICCSLFLACRGGNLKKRKIKVKLGPENYERLLDIQREKDLGTCSETIEFLIDNFHERDH